MYDTHQSTFSKAKGRAYRVARMILLLVAPFATIAYFTVALVLALVDHYRKGGYKARGGSFRDALWARVRHPVAASRASRTCACAPETTKSGFDVADKDVAKAQLLRRVA